MSGTAWRSEADVPEQLSAEYESNNVWPVFFNLFLADGMTTERFDAKGVLLSISTRTGLAQRLTYTTGQSNDTAISRYPAEAPACGAAQNNITLPAGLLACVTDQWGRQVKFIYDVQGRVVEAIDPASESYYFEYDGLSGGCLTPGANAAACSAGNLTKVTYPGGRSQTYYYNEPGRINGGQPCGSVSPTSASGNDSRPGALTGLVDENNDRLFSWSYACDGRATSSEEGDGLAKVSLEYGYNSTKVSYLVGPAAAPVVTPRTFASEFILGTGKNVAIDQPCIGCGQVKSRSYDGNGNLTWIVNFNNVVSNYSYDTIRNLEIQKRENTDTYSSARRVITTAWHPTLKLRARIAEALKITAFTYDTAGNMLTRSEQATTDTYGENGFTATTVGLPRTWTYTYTAEGRIKTITGPRTDVADITRFEYDNAGNLIEVRNALNHVTTMGSYNSRGQVGLVTAPTGATTEYTYTRRGWLESEVVTADGVAETTSYEYDGVGQVKKVTMPDESFIAYEHDATHRLTSVTDNLGNRIQYTLDLTGNRLSEQVKDGSGNLARNVSRVFDTLNRVQQQTGGVQ